MRDVNIKVQVCQMIFYVPERQEDTESGDGVAASGGPSICLHDPYRVCGLSARPLPGLRIVCTTLTGSADCLHDPYRVCELSARPLPGLRSAGVQTKRRDQKRETTHREPPMVTRSSSRAMTKSGVPSAFTKRMRTW